MHHLRLLEIQDDSIQEEAAVPLVNLVTPGSSTEVLKLFGSLGTALSTWRKGEWQRCNCQMSRNDGFLLSASDGVSICTTGS